MSITPCLWFDTQGEEAAAFYTAVFPVSRILEVSHYGDAGPILTPAVLTAARGRGYDGHSGGDE